jgi:predicted transcriptional regulator
MNTAQKIKELEEKLKQAEEKYRFRLSHFRGVPHESAAGELSYSELKVAEDFVHSIKEEIESLKKLDQNSTLNKDK